MKPTTYELSAPGVQIAHNTLARTIWVIHDGDEEGTKVTCLQPDVDEQVELHLPHDVTRFTHQQTLTCLHGNYGASILSGSEVLFSTAQLGPYQFENYKVRRAQTPDIRGQVITGEHLGNLHLEPFLGTPIAAAQYRGLTLGFFDGPYFSAIGQIHSRWSEFYPRPHLLGEIYIHPQSKLVSIATPEGWAYSLDDTRTWHFLPQEGWPIKVSDSEIWLMQGNEVKRREAPR